MSLESLRIPPRFSYDEIVRAVTQRETMLQELRLAIFVDQDVCDETAVCHETTSQGLGADLPVHVSLCRYQVTTVENSQCEFGPKLKK